MTAVIVGRWGKNLAIRVPTEVARATGLADGEEVEVEMQDRDIVIHRRAAHARARDDAEAAAGEITEESRRYSLGNLSSRELLEEGRRG
ncbi:MAG TPA: AbrB/MazE/SpoVT family DNA-binding domain-containing protein [Rhizomicrobium sp.]|jgi:antitoxin component of MazEF toxin-antitoxin module|nr:AbrB/MazE/SpoVT family DNA-binding domain-containing protein [Rhizomicrobium sp.]